MPPMPCMHDGKSNTWSTFVLPYCATDQPSQPASQPASHGGRGAGDARRPHGLGPERVPPRSAGRRRRRQRPPRARTPPLELPPPPGPVLAPQPQAIVLRPRRLSPVLRVGDRPARAVHQHQVRHRSESPHVRRRRAGGVPGPAAGGAGAARLRRAAVRAAARPGPRLRPDREPQPRQAAAGGGAAAAGAGGGGRRGCCRWYYWRRQRRRQQQRQCGRSRRQH